MDLKKLIEANKIYESLADLSKIEAMSELETYDDLDHDVLKLTKSLITNSDHSSTYFDKQISQRFQKPLLQRWQAGDKIGGYELIELIGQGGMALVFKAQRTESEAQKPVAIKIFNLSNQNPEIKAKFIAEQQILSQLTHPHIMNFHHGNNTENGDSFLVMELVESNLAIDEYVVECKLNVSAIIDLIIQAAEALQYAHNHLIIHRDVKPSNLLVDNNGQLKVVDFGIAKLIEPDLDPLNLDHSDTLLALTPSFASPEQLNAKTANISTDVFSLGAVAVFLLTGKQPFPANRMIQAGQGDVDHVKQLIQKHVKDQNLRNVLLKALKPEPLERYPNMFAFISDLKAWQAKKPVSASGDSWWYRLKCFIARRTALFITSVLLVLTVSAAIIGLNLQNHAITKEANKAEAVKNFMLNAFSVTDPNYSQGVDISSKDLLRLAADKIDSNQSMDEEIKFELYQAMGLAYGRLGFYPESIELLNKALSLKPNDEQSTTLLAQYLFNAAEIQNLTELLAKTNESQFDSTEQKIAIKRVRANLLAQAGKHKAALKVYQELESGNLLAAEIIKNKALLAEIHYLNSNSAESIKILQQVKQDYPLPATDIMQLGLNSDLVQYHDQVGNFDAAMKLTLTNIEAFKTILGDQHPDLGVAYNALSLFQRLDGKLDQAIASAEISASIFRERYGDSSEGLAQALSNIGVAQYYNQQPELAINITINSQSLRSIT